MAALLGLLPIALLSTGLVFAASESALKLTGRSSEFGPVVFTITSAAIGARNKLGLTLWNSNDPDNVVNVNFENKTFLRLPFDQWRLSDNEPRRRRELERVEFIEKTTLCGQKCSHYVGYRSWRNQSAQPVVDFWCIEKPPFSPDSVIAWCGFYHLPTKYGLPIQVKARRHWVHEFEPKTIGRVPLANAISKIPSGFTRAKDKAQLIFGGGNGMKSSDIEDLFTQPLK